LSRDVLTEHREGGLIAAIFAAMASPCEIVVETTDRNLAQELGARAAAEAWRIEEKFSRYRSDSIVGRINASAGAPIEVDEETASLLDFAARCHELSDGAFDITSGVLRRCWKFDGHSPPPSAAAVDAVLAHVGWQKLKWYAPSLTLPAGMEIDFGGIGKEYAVDRALQIVSAFGPEPILVNFGGDLACVRAPSTGGWQVGVERPDSDRDARLLLELRQGALATSGDTHRCIVVGDVRYGHILNPRTGWPVRDVPRSVTVAAGSCIEAGTFATFAMLQGAGAEQYLDSQGLKYWCLR
jgi:thiamine biosynthesis lipoprotein